MTTEESGDTTKTLEEKVEESIYRVTQYRKHFPKRCSHLLSKKIKIQHFMLENVKIPLRGDEKRSEDINSVEEVEEPLFLHNNTAEKIADLQKGASNLINVLDQIKSEANCPVNKMTGI